MRLYYAPGACSLSPHIVVNEAGIPVELSRVTFSAEGRTTEQGEDFFKVNPKGGYVPALRLDDGDVLMEGAAIIQYLSDNAPDKHLSPEKGTKQYYKMLEWVAFISTELHKGFGPLFRSDLSDSEKEAVVAKLKERFGYVNESLEGKEYLIGDFSIADAYCYAILRWSPLGNIDLAEFPNILPYLKRLEARDAVSRALAEEGLEAYASA